MMAAEFSSITKTKSVSTICAARNGVIALVGRHRVPGAPFGRQRASPFPDMGLVFVPEVLQRRQHRRHRRVTERAQRLAPDVGRNAGQPLQISRLAFTALDAWGYVVQPVGALPARRALAA